MSTQDTAERPAQAAPGPGQDLNLHIAGYARALAAFEREPPQLLRALLARDRVDAELHHQAGPSGGPPPLETARRRCAALVERIGRGHPSYQDALLYQHRLIDALEQVERYGQTDTLRAESNRVLDRLNSLALAALGVPFSELDRPAPALAPAADDRLDERLVSLDGRLRTLAFRRFRALAELPNWRRSFSPPATAWWWHLDQQLETTEHERDFIWYFGAGLCTMISLTVSLEIIKRLWSHAPDVIAIFGTLLTILLTGSPLIKQGRELGLWALRHLPWLSPRYRGEAAFAAAALSMGVVLIGWFMLPLLGKAYNSWGDAALRSGDLVAAEQWFQGATAVSPELTVAYYNLAAFYEESGSLEEAIRWYRTSIERDRQFRPAYFGLGSLYNRQGDYALAEQVLLTGLNITNPRETQDLTAYADYMLLSNLGWTLAAQGRFARAETILQEALDREDQVQESARTMLPHYYMAQVHCQFRRPEAAMDEIQETLRFGNPVRRDYQIWSETVSDYLSTVKASALACAALPAHTPAVITELPTMRGIP